MFSGILHGVRLVGKKNTEAYSHVRFPGRVVNIAFLNGIFLDILLRCCKKNDSYENYRNYRQGDP